MYYKKKITGSRNTKSIFTMVSLFLGGITFFGTGIGSYYKLITINYFPQGILMIFYGSFFTILSIYLGLTIFWNIGSGYNEFFTKKKMIFLVRKNFPGRNKLLFFSYSYKFVKLIKFLKKDGLNPRSNILLVLKDKREIPIYPAQFLLKPDKVEKEAIRIANMLNVSLEIKQN